MRLALILLAASLVGCASQQLGAGIAGPNLAAADLLANYSSTSVTDINAGTYIGPNGVNTDPSQVGLFDLRLYRSVVVLFYSGGLTGGTTPTDGVQMFGYNQATYPGAGYWESSASPGQVAATGGPQKIMAGEVGTTISGSGAESLSGTVVSYLPLFAHLKISSTGAPTGVNAPGIQVVMYGKR